MISLRPFLALANDAPPELDLSRYLATCGLLVAAIVGVGWLFRRFVAGTLKSRASQRSIRVVDLLPLGGRQKVCVVRCYDRTFVLGLGTDVNLIAELDAESVEPAEPEASDRKADRRAFARELLRVHSELVSAEEAPSKPAASAKPERAPAVQPSAPTPVERSEPSQPAQRTAPQRKAPQGTAPHGTATQRKAPQGTATQRTEPQREPQRTEPRDVQRLREALGRPEGILG